MELFGLKVIGCVLILNKLQVAIGNRQAMGHGRLMKPPSRNAMWRLGFPNPVNFNDNELFCGGRTVHHEQNDGKCGVCGDNFKLEPPRPHEIGGKYGNSIIGAKYDVNEDIWTEVELTSNHLGTFEYSLCILTEAGEDATQECFDDSIVPVVNEDGSLSPNYTVKNVEKRKKGKFFVKIRLPPFISCSHCVLQWKYTAGNSWGNCEDGSYATGCGAQETFINCADIKIEYKGLFGYALGPQPTSEEMMKVSRFRVSADSYREDTVDNSVEEWTPANLAHMAVVDAQLCLAVPETQHIFGIDEWCQINCLRYPSSCPGQVCQCVDDCVATESFRKTFPEPDDAETFCQIECQGYPRKDRNCSADLCICSYLRFGTDVPTLL